MISFPSPEVRVGHIIGVLSSHKTKNKTEVDKVSNVQQT